MEPLPQTPGLPAALPTARYARHRPEATLLYELVDQHYPPFLAALERDGRTLPTLGIGNSKHPSAACASPEPRPSCVSAEMFPGTAAACPGNPTFSSSRQKWS
jgi:hypothetical protein